jgi:predicted component of type VI protein secretion system
LGSCSLGNDLICGAYAADADPVMEFEIGPLTNSAVEDYLENGPFFRFLSCFYSYFIPMEMEAVTTVSVSNTQQHFILDDPASNAILGFNTGI